MRSPATLPPGERLGKYEIVRLLGVGGMAEVYLARARGIEGFEKLFAIKRILPELARDQEFIDMFVDEARLAARLSHPNVVHVYDIGADRGGHFFAMEYLEGHDVGSLLKALGEKGAGLGMGHALAIVVGAAAGLHHAHEARDEAGEPLHIVHRDVSLANLIVTYDGTVKVVDFGIAKALSRRSKTVTGNIKGKVGYLSPEQCEGLELDRRSDVFALGVVLFELTTGTRLFGKMDDFAIMHRIVKGDLPSPSSRRKSYPKALERVVERALARDTGERYPTLRALAVDLEAYARDEKLDLSPAALAELMRGACGEPPRFTARRNAPPPAAASLDREAPTRAEPSAEATRASLSASIRRAARRSGARTWLAAGALGAVGLGVGLLWGRRTPPLDLGSARETPTPTVERREQASAPVSPPWPTPPSTAVASASGDPPKAGSSVPASSGVPAPPTRPGSSLPGRALPSSPKLLPSSPSSPPSTPSAKTHDGLL